MEMVEDITRLVGWYRACDSLKHTTGNNSHVAHPKANCSKRLGSFWYLSSDKLYRSNSQTRAKNTACYSYYYCFLKD